MPFQNPDGSGEILYGASGDVRGEINSFVQASTAGHYADESEIPGSLIVGSLRKATRLINGYLEPVYSANIPFTAVGDVPVMLDEIASDIACYFVWRSSYAKLGSMPDTKKEQYYDQYVRDNSEGKGLLVKIAEKKFQLPELTASSPGESKSVRERGRPPVFDLDDPTRQDVSGRLLDDIDRERELGN